jgi:hypothetical protein
MPSKLVRMISGCIVTGIVSGTCTPSIALQKSPLAQVKCECGCEKAHEGQPGEIIYESLGTKSFPAPGGDPNACAGLNGTTCRTGTAEGKLSKCSGVVEHKPPKGRNETAPPPAGIKP